MSLFEAAVASTLEHSGFSVFIYDVNGDWIRPSGLPHRELWMGGYRLGDSRLMTNEVNRFLQDRKIEKVITLGVEAAGFAAQHIRVPVISLFPRGALDFSGARKDLTQEFERVLSRFEPLFFQDDWEMDKAVSKGSKAVHLKFRAPHLYIERALKPFTSRAHVGILTREENSAKAESAKNFLLDNMPGTEVTNLTYDYLYRSNDMRKRREVSEVLRTRLQQYTHLLLLDSYAAQDILLGSLRGEADRIYVEGTIGNEYLCEQIGHARVGRGLNIVKQLMDGILSGGAQPASECDDTNGSRGVSTWLDSIEAKRSAEYPDGYEELDCVTCPGEFAVFFSTAALEDRSNGARPQRIRHMATALRKEYPTVRLFSHENFLQRRVTLINRLVGAGRQCAVFYGENSTTTISSDDVIKSLGSLIRELSAQGAKTGWFVRDLRWLDSSLDTGSDDQLELQRRIQGEKEFRLIARHCETIYAPSSKSGEMFNCLLNNTGIGVQDWVQLPPGVDPDNILDNPAITLPESGVTLVYTGGIGEIYAMETYLEVVSILAENPTFQFDFIVRPQEADLLRRQLAERNIPRSAVRCNTDPFDLYYSRTGRTIGVTLLDSSYGRSAFPYKTMSFVEKSIPVLTFSDSGNASFVKERGIGEVVGDSVEDIVRTISRMINDDYSEAIARVQETETWKARVQTARQQTC